MFYAAFLPRGACACSAILCHRTALGPVRRADPRTRRHPSAGLPQPRIGDRIVFDKLVQVAVLGAAYERIADSICSATTIRRRRDEWIEAGIFETLEQICLEA